jgi:heme exporter protein D
VPLCFGSWLCRILGCLALCFAVIRTVYEYREGKVLEQRRQRRQRRQQMQQMQQQK